MCVPFGLITMQRWKKSEDVELVAARVYVLCTNRPVIDVCVYLVVVMIYRPLLGGAGGGALAIRRR